MRTPKGHIRRRGGSYEISVPVGRDPVTKRYRYAYEYAPDEETAQRKRDELIARVVQGREPMNRATVSELLSRWLSVAELELSTRVGYEGYIDRVIRPVLGNMRLRDLEARVDILDVLYAELRHCRRLCGGRKGLVDHRPLGRGRRGADGEPQHECDERCRPHQCRPLEPSSIGQIHSILRRAFNFALKWRWMTENPARLATVPRSAVDRDSSQVRGAAVPGWAECGPRADSSAPDDGQPECGAEPSATIVALQVTGGREQGVPPRRETLTRHARKPPPSS